MLTMILATALVFSSPSSLPNGLSVDTKNTLFNNVIYRPKTPTISMQQQFINTMYDKQMKFIKSNNMDGDFGYRNLLNDTIFIGYAPYNDGSRDGKVQIKLDMTYRFNEAKE
ncbi:hypothetical protein ABHN84_19865 [Shewanella vesiculosa]|uniref:Uncharacterized protein n=1 Tax=Shewanella vesiculosa TaxID=518738 RepID=A0ABV0FUK7_9GAMM